MSARAIPILIGATLLSTTVLAEPSGDAARGAQVYEAKMCNLCHTLGGEAGPMAELGGVLDQVGANRSTQWLRDYLLDPAGTLPGAQMPKTELTPQELADLVAYMSSLR
ncbi:c-type cytochrome [Marichromatium bheemlicum]|uniref:Cytochrome c n=1 Tax=Marichromatium bheemlicum TaxID=365339 RepID=A0ABX1I3R1_9GAMM|nr:cytochrome c [Marichromatium bheemlicum]NKN31666.1 cytochrome c [Marichromatium bheemlicum]